VSTESARLADQLIRAQSGDPWHGSPVKAILDGVDAEAAAWKPAPGVHSIWELVLHMTGWRTEVARRASGAPASEPEGGDWPAVGDPTPARWTAALAALDRAHAALMEAIAAMTDERLTEPSNDPRDRSTGAGVSYYELFHGIVQHDAYHAGQIAILKSLISERTK
jgi:uncharacterized damage-inducible protein DinB